MTEDEAKQKWCPMTRMADANQGYPMNRGNQGGNGCIGSQCMMWRSHRTISGNPENKGAVVSVVGYCGLAGKP